VPLPSTSGPVSTLFRPNHNHRNPRNPLKTRFSFAADVEMDGRHAAKQDFGMQPTDSLRKIAHQLL
jgi:hypothetical protein